MLTMNQTPGTDSTAIWIVRINLDADGYLYFADTEDKITLSGVDFDGKVIFKDSLSEIEKLVDASLGGSIGQVGNFGFALSRYTGYTGIANFMNDLYPATSKPLLTSKTVDVGICWDGATLTSQITWLQQFYVEDYSFVTNRMDAFCIEYDELSGKDLPPFVIQDSFDDGISYFTNAPDESKGQPIPIVYGDFTDVDLRYTKYQLVPTVRIDKRDSSFLVSSHILNATNLVSALYRYLENAGTVMTLLGASSSLTNTRAGHRINLDSNGSLIYGNLDLQPKIYTNYFNPDGDSWDYTEGGTNKEYSFDGDSATYCELAPDREYAVKLGTNLSQSELGVLGGWGSNEEIELYIQYDTTDQAYPVVKYYHPTMGVNSGYSPLKAEPGAVTGTGLSINYYIGNGEGINVTWSSDPKKHEDGVPWTIDELQVLQFHIQNKATSTGSLRIKNIVLRFYKIAVTGTDNKIIISGADPLTQIIRSRTNYAQRAGLQPIKFTGVIDTNMFALVKGLMYEGWID